MRQKNSKVFRRLTLSIRRLYLLLGVVFFGFAFISFSTPTYAAVPYQMNFQGRLNDSTGAPMPNGTYNMTFRIYSGSTGGSPLWSEIKLVSASQGVAVTTGGLFSTQLGSVTPLPPAIFDTSTPLYLEVELPTPATATSTSPLWTEGAMAPRNPIASSPYAINSQLLGGHDTSYYQQAGNYFIQGGNSYGAVATLGATDNYGLNLVTNNSIRLGISAAGSFSFNTSQLYIDNSSGNIGIGTASPSAKLQVAGNTLVQTDSTSALSVQNAGGAVVLNVDSVNSAVSVGGAGLTYNGPLHATSSVSFMSKDSYTASNMPDGMAVADLNNDGYLDIVGVNYGNAKASVYLNKGDGTYNGQATYTVGSNPYAVALADFNGDGYVDMASADHGSTTVSLLTNKGDGTFNARTTVTAGSAPYHVIAADVNEDGRPDLLVANDATAGTVTVLLNNGGGTFAAGVAYTVGKNPYSVAAADINDDGHLDMIAANKGSNTLSIRLGNGNGTFGAETTMVTSSEPYSVIAADVDGDGYKDLVVANHGSNTMSVFFNNGFGVFSGATNYTTQTGPYFVVAADFNGDGHLDIGTVNYNSNSASVFVNNGDGTFAGQLTFATGSSPNAMAVGDINNDGLPDIVTANPGILGFNAYTITLRNNTTFGSDTYGSSLSVRTASASTSGLIIQGSSAQTADYLHIQDASGAAVFQVDAGGNLAVSGVVSALSVHATGTGSGFQSDANHNAFYSTITPVADPRFAIIKLGDGGNLYGGSSAGTYFGIRSKSTADYLNFQYGGATKLKVNYQGNLWSAGNISAAGTVQGGIGSPDYAENITTSDDSIGAADVVAMDPSVAGNIVKAATPYDSKILGVVSTNPGFLTNASSLDEASAPDQRPLALSGRVPVKVSTVNGDIQVGDYLTASSIPGVAMRATRSGQVIGVAMESYSGDINAVGRVLMFINNSYYSPADAPIQGSDQIFDSIVTRGDISAVNLSVSGATTLRSLVVTGDASLAKITVNGHIISAGNTPDVAVGADFETAMATISGTDSAGTISFVASDDTSSAAGQDKVLAVVRFANPYDGIMRIVLSPNDDRASSLSAHVEKIIEHGKCVGFKLVSSAQITSGLHASYDYIAIDTPSGQ